MNLFISYNGADSAFATRLAEDLRRIGHEVWFDKTSIHAGDHILDRVSAGLDGADVLLLALSHSSRNAPFVTIEWLAATWNELQQRGVIVIPLLIGDVEMPALLRGRRWADFRTHYIVGWTQLVTALDHHDTSADAPAYRPDVVDINDDWIRLFTTATQLDLAIMYGATWRNTYRKHLARLATEGRLRVILPDPADGSPVLPTYARRLGIPPAQVAALVHAAITDFTALGPHVEIHLADVVFTHAIYLFDTGAILALYAMCCQRIPTPALVFTPGQFTDYARTDLSQLISHHTRPVADRGA